MPSDVVMTCPNKAGELIRNARDGGPKEMEQLRQAMKADPAIWLELGNLGKIAEKHLIQAMIAGEKGKVTAETFHFHAETLREELAGPNPSPLERLLVERIVLCWLQVNHADYHFTDTLQTGRGIDTSVKYQESAQKRYLQAIKTLAQVRRLQVPMVQVNIGERQVNVQGSVG